MGKYINGKNCPRKISLGENMSIGKYSNQRFIHTISETFEYISIMLINFSIQNFNIVRYSVFAEALTHCENIAEISIHSARALHFYQKIQ